MSQTLDAQLSHKARELGFNQIGFIPAQPARRLDAYLRWVDEKMHGRMGYMARPDRLSRRQDLNVILPGVKTIICVGLDYFTQRLPTAVTQDPSRGRLSNYAWNLDYHDIMTPRLQQLADWLTTTSPNVQSRVYVDTGAILERDHAETAGLGFSGKNTMLIHPRQGSFFFLGEILTTLEIGDWRLEIQPISNLQSPISCGTCRCCLDACPTNAFSQPYVLDARRCISYLTIELKEWIPVELRPRIGNWIYGCDICQEVCPFNRFTQPTSESAFYPHGNRDSRLEIRDSDDHSPKPLHQSCTNLQSLNTIAPPLLELLTLDEAGFNNRFAHSPIKRIKRVRFIRNVCVAVGNWGSETAVPLLIPLLTDPEPLIRGHAAWALHQIGSPQAQQALANVLPNESHEKVRQELIGPFRIIHSLGLARK
ncbi:MAG: tRNA epoxyqueuosine(34) reductase QueG [Chloroflexi bacterium]|nr:tRNA epoxyqueuosine(34) reductase QueG [Chloroflexota bacterium]